MRALGLLVLAAGVSPVTRVVELLKKLQTNALADQAAEQKAYDKYACWCETTTARKAAAIDQAKADVRAASNDVLALRGKRAGLAGDIDDNADSIQTNEESTHTMTLVRKKNSADAGQEVTKMDQTVGALETAIRLVRLNPALVTLRNTTASKADRALAPLAAEKVAAASDHPLVKNLTGAALLQYDPLHEKLLGILTSLYSTFRANAQEATDNEATARSTFTTILAEKTAELTLLEASTRDKEGQMAQKAAELASKEQQMLDLHDQLDADEAFFAQASTDCTDESNAWDTRNGLRNEELSGISQALDLLTDDANRRNFAAAMSFIQLRRAVAPLHRSSPRVAAIAAVATTKAATAAARAKGDGDFDAESFAAQGVKPVIDAIDQMQTDMKDEEAEDITQRDWCIEEQTSYTHKAENLTYDIKVLNNKVKKLETENEAINKEIDDLTGKLATLAEEVSEATTLRGEQEAAYTLARSQDVEAQGVLNSTLDALMAFYDNNNLDVHNAAATASGVPRTQLLQARAAQPEFAIGEDVAPDTVATGKSYSGRTGGDTKAILDLLAMLVNNLGNEVSEADAAEMQAKQDFAAFETASTESKEAMELSVQTLEGTEATNLGKIGDHTDVKGTTQGELDSTHDYLDSIAPNCDWIRGAFYTRLNRRKSEMEGLTDAKTLLSGGSVVTMAAVKSVVKTAALNVNTASTDQLLDSLSGDFKKWSAKAYRAELIKRHRMWVTEVAPAKKHGPPKHPPDMAVARKANAKRVHAFLMREPRV